MSADNGVYILITTDKFKKTSEHSYENVSDEGGIKAYRVAHAQAIDSFEWYKENEPHNLGYFLYRIWKKSPIFYKKGQALSFACDLHKKMGWTEYGISHIDAREFNFPDC